MWEVIQYHLSNLDIPIFCFVASIRSKKFNLKLTFNLDDSLFQQVEGITFYDRSDMFIFNEGESKQPTLLRFEYRLR
jgi:hypothetical protein